MKSDKVGQVSSFLDEHKKVHRCLFRNTSMYVHTKYSSIF